MWSHTTNSRSMVLPQIVPTPTMDPSQKERIARNGTDLESVLAKELHKLTINDRNLVQEEIHCVSSMAVKEVPSMVDNALAEIRDRTTAVVSAGEIGTDEFRRHFSSNLQFVHSKAICLKYLRVDFFDVGLATKRMMNHLELLFRFFGPVALQRPLRFSDLVKEEQDAFRGGSFQTLPSRDKAGRLVLVHQTSVEGANHHQRLRVVMYNHSVISEDEDSQKHGIVIVFAVDAEMMKHIQNQPHADLGVLYANLPYRMAANHQCFPEGPAFQFIKAFWIIVLASQDQRVRTKFHGDLNQLETQYSLMSYGLPVHQLPRTHTGTIKTKNQLQWIKTRRAIDKARMEATCTEIMYGNCNIISHPGKFDVLFSRGGNATHPGNTFLQDDISSRLEEFKSKSNKESRQRLREEIMEAVNERNGRFLTLNKGGWWEELSEEKIHEKITTSFYDYKRKIEIEERRQIVGPTDRSDMILTSSKRQRTASSSDDGGCFCFQDPYEDSKCTNPFL